MWGQLDRML